MGFICLDTIFSALFIKGLFFLRPWSADAVADAAALMLQSGKLCLGSLNICLQVSCRVDTVFLQEVIVGNQLLQILFRRPQIRRQQHYIGKLGYDLDRRYDKVKHCIHQNSCGVIAVLNGETQLSQLVLQWEFLRLVRRSVFQGK